MNTDYSQFYKGTSSISTYGNGAYGKDTIARYEFNTTNEKGEKIREKMSKEETMRTLNDISSRYGENVIVEFSGDGLAALVAGKKPCSQQVLSEGEQTERSARQAEFDKTIVNHELKAGDFPAYSGIYKADKAIATAVENINKDERSFVYGIIRQNFLISDTGSMTEDERQANIALGMKKAEYAAENFIPAGHREDFLKAMRDIAGLASAGQKTSAGSMDYGINEPNYLGHGSGIVYTTNAEDLMKRTDSKAYQEYSKLNDEDGDDKELNRLRYLSKWYANSVSKNQKLVQDYEETSEEYISTTVEKQNLSKAFDGVDVTGKQAFYDSLRKMQENGSVFFSLIQKELSNMFWVK